MAEVSLRNYQRQVEAHLRDERLEEAVAHSSHILGSYPKNAASYRVLGGALLLQGRYEEAEEIYRRLLGVYPNDYEANANLSRVYEKLEQGDFALWYAERALDQRPNDRQTNERMRNLVHRVQGIRLEKIQLTAGAVANQYLKAGRTQQAIDLLQGALSEAPDRVDLRLRLAQAFWKAGATVEAAETALEVLQSLPYAAEANEILAQLWLEEGRPSDAQRYLSRIEAVEPYAALAIAVGSEPDADAYTIEELNFAQYAASVDVENPDWLESLGEDDFHTTGEMPSIDLDAEPETESYEIEDLFNELGFEDDDEAETAASSDADIEAFFADLETDDEALEESTGLTDLLGSVDEVEDEETPSEETPRAHTGLTGLLNLPEEEEEAEEEDLSLDDLFASIGEEEADFFDDFEDEADEPAQPQAPSDGGTVIFGEEGSSRVEDLFADLDDFDDDSTNRPGDEADPTAGPEGAASTTDFFGDLPDDWDPQAAEELASRFVDESAEDSQDLPTELFAEDMDWATENPPTQENDEEDEDDPLAWMRESGIDFDEQALGGTVIFDEDPTSVESEDSDPLAWMQDSGIEYEGGDSNKFVMPEELREDAPPPPDDTMEFDDPQGPPPPAEMLYQEQEDEEEPEPIEDWLTDDDILDEMLNLEALTDEPESPEAAQDDLFADMDWQATMNDQPDRNENDNPPGDDDNFEWLDEDQFQDELPPAEEELGDPMAWLDEAGAELEDEEEEAFDDPMAWLNEVGAEIEDEDAPDSSFDPQTSVTDYFSENDPLEQQQMGATDYLSEGGETPLAEEPEEEAPHTGLTGMLSRADAFPTPGDDDGEDDEEPAAEADLDWLSELDEPAAAQGEEASDWGDLKSGFTDEFAQPEEEGESDWGDLKSGFTDELAQPDSSAEEEDPDWAKFDQGFTEELDQDELIMTGDEPSPEDATWAGMSEEATAETPAEPPAEAEEWLEAFQQEDSEELDWLSALDESETPEEPEEPTLAAAEEDPFGFGKMDLGEPEPAAEADWLSELEPEGEEEQEDFFAAEDDSFDADEFFPTPGEDDGEDEALPAAEADWLADLEPEGDDMQEQFFAAEDDSFGADEFFPTPGDDDDEDEAAELEELDWLAEPDLEEEPLPFEEEQAAAEAAPLGWDEEEDLETAPTGMTELLQSIREEEPQDEFAAFPEEEEQAPEEAFDWGDLEDEPAAEATDADWLEDFGDMEEVEEGFDAEPAATLEAPDEQFEEEPLYEEDEYEEELDFAPTENVPDWLNAMVPGLDINYSAEEDAPVEDEYEEGVTHRARIQTESGQFVTSTGDFGWLQAIVDEEIHAGEGEERGTEDGRRRQRFIFSRLPRWLMRPRRDTQAVPTPPPAAGTEQAVEKPEPEDFEDFDLDAFDDLDDDFEFDDFDDDRN